MELEIDARSRPWRQRLGWLSWAVLEDVALSARREGDAWVAPVGGRAVAQNLGMTKDTAAKALAALAAEGTVERLIVRTDDGKTRSGYRVKLPEGLRARSPRDASSESADPSETKETAAKAGAGFGPIAGVDDGTGHGRTTIRRSEVQGLPNAHAIPKRTDRKSAVVEWRQGRLFDPAGSL